MHSFLLNRKSTLVRGGLEGSVLLIDLLALNIDFTDPGISGGIVVGCHPGPRNGMNGCNESRDSC